VVTADVPGTSALVWQLFHVAHCRPRNGGTPGSNHLLGRERPSYRVGLLEPKLCVSTCNLYRTILDRVLTGKPGDTGIPAPVPVAREQDAILVAPRQPQWHARFPARSALRCTGVHVEPRRRLRSVGHRSSKRARDARFGGEARSLVLGCRGHRCLDRASESADWRFDGRPPCGGCGAIGEAPGSNCVRTDTDPGTFHVKP
jgi:hypothetical protein